MRLRELYDPIVLFENYNGKLNKLKKEFPDQTAEIDARVNWATEVFKVEINQCFGISRYMNLG